MSLSVLAEFAAIAIALVIFTVIIAVIIDSVVLIVSNFRCAYAMVKVADQMAKEQEDFDRHVQTTPGMRPYMHTLN